MTERVKNELQKVEPLTERECEYVEQLIAKIGGRGTIRAKACWRNAQRLLIADWDARRLQYWECGLPIPHAWVTINGKVVDVTAGAVERALKRMGFTPDGSTNHNYRGGVIVQRDAVLKNIKNKHVFGPVLGETSW